MGLYLGEKKISGVKVAQELVDHAVLYTPQKLSYEEKRIARENIDVASALETGTYVTPEMFNAVGDGKADDTKAIKDAVATGKTVLLAGKYKVTQTIDVKKVVLLTDDCEILVYADVDIFHFTGNYQAISGRGNINIKVPDYTANVIKITGMAQGIEISGVTIRGYGWNEISPGTAINMEASAGAIVYCNIDCKIYLFNHGIVCDAGVISQDHDKNFIAACEFNVFFNQVSKGMQAIGTLGGCNVTLIGEAGPKFPAEGNGYVLNADGNNNYFNLKVQDFGLPDKGEINAVINGDYNVIDTFFVYDYAKFVKDNGRGNLHLRIPQMTARPSDSVLLNVDNKPYCKYEAINGAVIDTKSVFTFPIVGDHGLQYTSNGDDSGVRITVTIPDGKFIVPENLTVYTGLVEYRVPKTMRVTLVRGQGENRKFTHTFKIDGNIRGATNYPIKQFFTRDAYNRCVEIIIEFLGVNKPEGEVGTIAAIGNVCLSDAALVSLL